MFVVIAVDDVSGETLSVEFGIACAGMAKSDGVIHMVAILLGSVVPTS